ncbi:hypothetical protein ACOSQ3_020233 [Xanthoceras sorbifolium]
MDAKILTSLLEQKLKDLQKSTRSNPRFENQVQTAIQYLKQLLKDAEDPGEETASSVDLFNDQKLSQILKVVYSVDDAIDTLLISSSSTTTERGFFKPFKGFKSLRIQTLITHKMKKYNDEIRRLVGIKEAVLNSENDTRRLMSQQPADRRWGRISGFCLEQETDVVGLEQQTKKLLIRLVSEQDQDEEFTQVIAVVGESGSGKTTLARSLYKRLEVKRHFTNRAWIHVPSLFNSRHVLSDILRQIDEAGLVVEATLSEAELLERLTRLLNNSAARHLIVLDDVQTLQVWETLLNPLCSSLSRFGAKIIVTARDANNLPPQAAHSALCLVRLNQEESWKLFSKKVRIAEDVLNNSELITLKEQILYICGGLPSEIVLLGGLLSTKEQSYDEWSRVIARASNPKDDTLALSYQDLPSQVKPCFLYMGLFPKGFEIPVRRLIHLWCAERFFTRLDPEDIDPETQAEICIEELVLRNMIQVRWKLDGSPKTCSMENVLYDFFSKKAANVGFINHELESSHTSAKQVRRLAAYVGIKSVPSSFLRVRNLHSYIAFDTRIRVIPDRKIGIFLNKIISNRGFGLLTVLDLEGVYKPNLSNDVVRKLSKLTYLGLKSTFIDELPKAVDKLPCLETLDVRHTYVFYIPIQNAKKLRHLYLNQENYTFWKGRYATPEDFFNEEIVIPTELLTNLHTVWDLFMKHGTYNPGWLQYLTRLKKLKVTAINSQKNVAEWVSKLTNLQSLKFRSMSDQEVPDGYNRKTSYIKLGTLAEHRKLQDLYLPGKFPKGAIDIHFLPPNLTNLTLSLSRRGKDPMPVLGQLPHLNILRLFGDSYVGTQMTCLSGAFPKLRLLKLWKLPNIQEWTVEDAAMPCLRELEIRDCKNLIKPPQGLQNVTTLREMVLTNMEQSFREAVEGILKSSST